jgi:hypothetical protein
MNWRAVLAIQLSASIPVGLALAQLAAHGACERVWKNPGENRSHRRKQINGFRWRLRRME